MKNGLQLIAEERERQAKAYPIEHDDAHDARELARAAACYATYYVTRSWLCEAGGVRRTLKIAKSEGAAKYEADTCGGDWTVEWPFEAEIWKPETPLRSLIKAGALIAAEIDRLQRREAHTPLFS